MGIVWHEYRIVSPMKVTTESYTGQSSERKYFVIGNRALQISGYRNESYADSQIHASQKRFSLHSWKLPFGTMVESEREVEKTERKLDQAQAKEAGMLQARNELLAAAGKDAVIKAENILHEHTENGKVLLTVLFEVEQSIEVERPIG
jgi:similar to stage IV sporulation protein